MLTTFFSWVGQIEFPSSPKTLKGEALKRKFFRQIFCAAGKFLKKQVKKAIFGHFLEILTRFFWRALPLKFNIYWRRRRH